MSPFYRSRHEKTVDIPVLGEFVNRPLPGTTAIALYDPDLAGCDPYIPNDFCINLASR